MNLHHTDDVECSLCAFKLSTAHEYLGSWFRRLKADYKNVHVSWAYRNAEEQERLYTDGKTHCHYPDSRHNNMKDSKPYSLALDIFQIDEDGVARFSPRFYLMVNERNIKDLEPIIWGGSFKSFKDADHFEMK